MKKYYVLLPLSLFLVTPFFSGAFFVEPLKLGDTGHLVIALQRILNLSADTRIADFGPGSSGNETDYFGSLTKNAVMKFQQKYAQDILIPAGLSNATGYVGNFTIKKLNILSTAEDDKYQITTPGVNVPAPSLATSSVNTSINSLPTIVKFSKTSFFPGETIKINGTGFIPPLTVNIGNYSVPNPKINNSTEIEAVLGSQAGIFLVWVGNRNGDSRASFPMFIVVLDSSAPKNISNIIESIEKQNDIIQKRAVVLFSL